MADGEEEKMAADLSDSVEANCRVVYNTSRIIGVEFPGVVRNTDKMLQALGGEAEVARAVLDPHQRIKVNFRPADINSKCLYGDRHATPNLLLSVKRRQSKDNKGYEYKQEVLGVVDTTFKFDNLVDFQYVSHEMKDPLDQVRGIEILNEEQPLLVLPPVFSRIEKPVPYNFKPNILAGWQPASSQATTDEQEGSKMAQGRNRNTYAMAVTFEHPSVPVSPHPKALESLSAIPDNKLEEIKRLFNNRPIWSRTALAHHLSSFKVTQHWTKQLLACVAYYYINGPWRTLWVKFGYNPAKDPSAKIYQVLDYRIGARKEGRDLPIPWKRNPFLKLQSKRKPLRQPQHKSEIGPASSASQDLPSDVPYVFSANKLPTQKQMFYQLCDLHVSEIQALVSANDGQETECLEREGWCLPGTLDKIRDILVEKTVQIAAQSTDDDSSSMAEDQASPWGKDTGQASPWEGTESNPWGEGQGELWGGNTEVKSFFEMLEGDDDVDAYEIFGDEDGDNGDENDDDNGNI
ncbi:general transcription factor 3C polypeptide 5 [Nematostella vectensis]|uniref:general transcription factor 3C polypeptide 5 n=1 Tax=Nematostella vectensis TaxID=45351 RepID=UPI0020770B07|nr:general transcription factor 3C polypeptide 5 [Nematostella vectensis]